MGVYGMIYALTNNWFTRFRHGVYVVSKLSPHSGLSDPKVDTDLLDISQSRVVNASSRTIGMHAWLVNGSRFVALLYDCRRHRFYDQSFP
jgi:hypothetical protein